MSKKEVKSPEKAKNKDNSFISMLKEAQKKLNKRMKNIVKK